MNSLIRKFSGGSVLGFNIGLTLIRQIMAALAQLLIVTLIARELGAEGNGLYAIAVLVPALMANFLNMGVGAATVFYISRGEHSLYQSLLGNLQLASLAVLIGFLLAVPVVYHWGDSILPGVPPELIYMGMAAFPLILMTSYLNTLLQGVEDFKGYNLTTLFPSYINLFVLLLLLYVFPLSDGVAGALIAYLLGHSCGVICAFWLVLRKGKVDKKAQPFTFYASKVLHYGFRAHLSNILAFINYRVDIFLVNFFLSPVATGIYVIAVQFAEKLWMLSQAASAVLLPRLSAMNDDPAARYRLSRKGYIWVSLATTVAALVASAALYLLIEPVFGREYLEVIPAFLWLIPGIVAGAGTRIHASCIAAAGKPQWNMYSSLFALFCNLVGNMVLIPEYGIMGAAAATSIVYCINALITVWMVRRLSFTD